MTARAFLSATDNWTTVAASDLPALSGLTGTLAITQIDSTGVTGQVIADIGASGLRWKHIEAVNIAPSFKSGSGVIPLATLSGLSSNDILKWSGSAWVNTPIPTSGILSINSDTTSAQTIVASDDMSAGTSSGQTTIRRAAITGSQAYWIVPNQFIESTTTLAVGANNRVHVHRFYLPYRLTVATVTFRIATGTAASNASIGVYSDDGTAKYIDTGPIASTGTLTSTTTLSPAATLSPGYYWFALTCSSTTPTFLCTANSSSFFNDTILNEGTAQFGRAANTSTAGQLPATLGAITAEDRKAFICKLQG